MPLFRRKPKVPEGEAPKPEENPSIQIDVSVLRKNNITRLTIDERWTKLFVGISMSPEIEKAQNEMNELIKQEAMLKNEQENLEPAKKKCMNKIISLTKEAFENENNDAKNSLKEYKKEIERINDRMNKIMEDIERVDDKLKEANIRLLFDSTFYIFSTLKNKKKKSEELTEELEALEKREKEIREELESIQVDWTSFAVNFTELIGADQVRKLEKEFGLEELMNEAGDSGADEDNRSQGD